MSSNPFNFQVLLSDKKYACETCIKGHRSSACKHTDRPLFEIKKKGRPVTQCEHCRELRKTKQVHVKCSCGSQDQGAPGAHEASHSKKGTPKLPVTAAFPHGLPEALETLATLLPSSDDSDHSGETSPTGCRCSSSGSCNCCVPRKPATRRRFSGAEPPKRDKHHLDASKHNHDTTSPPLSSHVLARIAELRPVLPRPTHRQLPLDGSLHDPSSSVPHGHSIRHHNYDYSPYGRAYGYTHSDHLHDQTGSPLNGDPHTFAGRPVSSPQPTLGSQPVPDAWSSVGAFPSVCACGDSCMCPGCTLHNNPSITGAAYASCTNPSTCAFCLDCTILSIPAGIPPPNIDSSSDPSQSQEFDEWLRQVALSPGASNPQPNFNPYELSVPQTQPYQTGRPRMPENPSNPSRSVERCGGQCKCPRNSCTCLPDCCGCCQGCQCDNHCNDGLSRTTFAVSGERGSCCRKAESNTSTPSAGRRLPDFMAMTNMRDQLSASGVGAGSQGYYGQQGAFLDYSETPSRSSSGSSLSSRMPSRPPSGPVSTGGLLVTNFD
ncbi:copper-fist transcription factor [Suillus paluster]|uniref:copper-fist transcription factor n=1 Tax=Suillus paluster TaxID=48578 RepID=UPI001B86D1E7|nr:copper-fist transcription factor [Suillus paluster]KAG1743749.1 copper-fist transcription factor [Suillus paluster]